MEKPGAWPPALTDAAAVIVFLVDVREGVVPLDQHVAERLRGAAKPVVFAANKADDPKFDSAAAEFFQLGYGEPVLVSANSGRGQQELLETVLAKLPPDTGEGPPDFPPDRPELRTKIAKRYHHALIIRTTVGACRVPPSTRASGTVTTRRCAAGASTGPGTHPDETAVNNSPAGCNHLEALRHSSISAAGES